MKRKTGILFMARAAVLLLAVMLTATTARAQEVYTVTLKAGDGSGSDITYRSDEGTIAANWQSAGNCQFYYENGAICFRLHDDFCPDSFTAPEGYLFYGWEGNYNTLTSTETVFRAKWRPDSEARITLSPTELSFTPSDFSTDGFMPVPVEITELDFGPNNKGDGCCVYIAFFHCDFESEGRTISSWVSENLKTLDEDEGGIVFHLFSKDDKSFTFYVYIDPTDLAAAAPGTYTGTMKVEFSWDGVADGLPRPDEGSITLKLNIPAPALSLTDNADNSTAISAADGEARDVTLSGRTLYLDDDWNTLCLPFNVNYLTNTPLEGFTVKELDTETAYNGHVTGLNGTTLYLNFKDASSIKAGKPYIVKKAIAASTIGRTATSGTAGYKESEGYASLVDGNSGTKWCSNTTYSGGNPWVCQFTTASLVNVTGYTLTTGNDTNSNQDRNPRKWTLEAKLNEGDAWMTIDSRDVTANASDALPTANTTESQVYDIAAGKRGKYQYFRFTVTQSGGNLMQLAELTLQGTADAAIVNPLFTGVIIDADEPTAVTSTDGTVKFCGNYDPINISGGDQSMLFLGSANKLYYPSGEMQIGAFRAHFELSDGITAGVPNAKARAFVLNFGDEEDATGIVAQPTLNSQFSIQSGTTSAVAASMASPPPRVSTFTTDARW